MYIRSKAAALIYKALFMLLCLYGLYHYVHGKIPAGQAVKYFSVLAAGAYVIYTLIYSVLIVRSGFGHERDPGHHGITGIHGFLVTCAVATCVIFTAVLKQPPSSNLIVNSAAPPTDLMMHYILPAMAVADWLMFSPRGRIRHLDPLKWLSVPAIYVIYAFIYANAVSPSSKWNRYPYFFMDIKAQGVSGVIYYAVLLILFFTALGYLVYFIDKGFAWFLNLGKRSEANR